MKDQLRIGYARLDVTPPLGVNIAGYFVERILKYQINCLLKPKWGVSSNDRIYSWWWLLSWQRERICAQKLEQSI